MNFHISSGKSRAHDDDIRLQDFPSSWYTLDLTVEVEAKAKELALLRLSSELKKGREWEEGSSLST